jgi:hypothetical protein
VAPALQSVTDFIAYYFAQPGRSMSTASSTSGRRVAVDRRQAAGAQHLDALPILVDQL